MRAAGLSYRELEREGFGFVVVEALVRYRRAAFFDDELKIRTQLTALTRALLRFEYAAVRGEELLATGYTRHACVRLPGGRPTRVPTWLLEALSSGESGEREEAGGSPTG